VQSFILKFDIQSYCLEAIFHRLAHLQDLQSPNLAIYFNLEGKSPVDRSRGKKNGKRKNVEIIQEKDPRVRR